MKHREGVWAQSRLRMRSIGIHWAVNRGVGARIGDCWDNENRTLARSNTILVDDCLYEAKRFYDKLIIMNKQSETTGEVKMKGKIVMAMMAPMMSFGGMRPFGSMTWFNEPEKWSVDNGTLTMQVTGQSDYWRVSHYGFTVDDGPFLYTERGGEFEAKVIDVPLDLRHEFLAAHRRHLPVQPEVPGVRVDVNALARTGGGSRP